MKEIEICTVQEQPVESSHVTTGQYIGYLGIGLLVGFVVSLILAKCDELRTNDPDCWLIVFVSIILWPLSICLMVLVAIPWGIMKLAECISDS